MKNKHSQKTVHRRDPYRLGNFTIAEDALGARFTTRSRSYTSYYYWLFVVAMVADFVGYDMWRPREHEYFFVHMGAFMGAWLSSYAYCYFTRVPALSMFPRMRRYLLVHRGQKKVEAEGYRSKATETEGYVEVDGHRYPLRLVSGLHVRLSVVTPSHSTRSYGVSRYFLCLATRPKEVRGYEIGTFVDDDGQDTAFLKALSVAWSGSASRQLPVTATIHYDTACPPILYLCAAFVITIITLLSMSPVQQTSTATLVVWQTILLIIAIAGPEWMARPIAYGRIYSLIAARRRALREEWAARESSANAGATEG